jgi:hypothetical protein
MVGAREARTKPTRSDGAGMSRQANPEQPDDAQPSPQVPKARRGSAGGAAARPKTLLFNHRNKSIYEIYLEF